MVQNIAIVGLNRKQSYEIAKLLAEELDMHFFDCLELFEFDNIPRSFPTMLKAYGEKYYRKKEKGMLKYVAGFCETVIHLESGMAELKTNIKAVKENCLLIYLHVPASKVKCKLDREKYDTKEEKKFFNIPPARIDERIENLKKGADIVILASSGSALKLTSEILRQIKAYYQVN